MAKERKPRKCIVCGKLFTPTHNGTKICTPECKELRKKEYSKKYYQQHRETAIQRQMQYQQKPEVQQRRAEYMRNYRARRNQATRTPLTQRTPDPKLGNVEPVGISLSFPFKDYMEESMLRFCQIHQITEEVYYQLTNTIRNGNWSLL